MYQHQKEGAQMSAAKKLKLQPIAKKTINYNETILKSVYHSQSVTEFTPDGVVISANEICLKQMGYSLAEVQGKSDSYFYDEAFAQGPSFLQLWAKLRRGESETGEYKQVGKNGKTIWYVASYNPILGDDGLVHKIVKFATDVTLTKTELIVRTDIMNLTSIVSEADLKGDILNVNDKFVEVSKYTRQELIGKGHNTTRHPDMPKEVFKEMWSTIGRGNIFRGIVKNRAKDGSPYYVDAVIAPILGDNGKPRKYLGVRYDITENEIERQNMKGVLRGINASFAYIEFDTEGNVVSANKIFQDFMGYTESDLKGRNHRQFCDPSLVRSPEYSQFWTDLRAGKNKQDVFKRFTKSGQEVWLQAVYSPVTDEVGRVIKVVKIATDTTELINAIISLDKMANKLAYSASGLTDLATQMSQNTEKTNHDAEFATGLSHEVATGVQIVATNTEEMVASIKEISRSANESANMSRQTLKSALDTNAIITKLGVSSHEVGNVIKLISSIAQQTNLLALNATIEAARAGDAGRGFAVVANEVKELAKQTAKATEDITTKIGAIQKDSSAAVDAISEISSSVEKLNGLSGAIAASVEEQTATTNEVSRVVVQSSKGVEDIANRVKAVSKACELNLTTSADTLNAAKELSHAAEDLRTLIKKIQKAN
ncbi:hypothetical protein CIK05_08140 [Bdellovibrio sp. qaytius]|nr:hypothetical protein CIK05_08140 [Bdellovibrio sp. qaytius]